jgi:hypothetical protein
MLQRIEQRRQQTAVRQAAHCRALAGELTAAAKKAPAGKGAQQAAALNQQAARFQTLAEQLEKRQ